MGKKTDHSKVPEYDGKVVGPIDKRRCHDLVFLIIFIAFWVGMFIVAQTGFKYGDPNKIIQPRDSFGNYCGSGPKNNSGPDLRDRPNLYYFNPISPGMLPSVCVKECPTTTGITTPSNAICTYGIIPNEFTLGPFIATLKCAPVIFSSNAILGRCIPLNAGTDMLKLLNETAGTMPGGALIGQTTQTLQVMVSDIMKTWQFLVGAVFTSVVVTFLWLFLLRFVAKAMVWTTIALVNLIFLGLAEIYYHGTEAGHDSENNKTMFTGAMYGTYVCLGLFGVMLLLTLIMRKRIRIAVEIIKEAARTVGKMPFIMFFPLFIWAAIAILFVYFLFVLLYTASIDDFSGTVEVNFVGNTLRDKYVPLYLNLYHVFGFLWTFNFLLGLNQLTIAGGFATYYWTLDKRAIRVFPVLRSFYRALRYHLGSVAFGSFLIAVVQMIRVVLWFIGRKVKKSKIKCLMCIITCIDCCLAAIAKIVKWINKNAYIKIAIDGKSFCRSCASAFGLIIRNGLRLIAVDLVSDFVLLLSKLVITAMNVMIYYGFFWWKQKDLQIQLIYAPLILIAVLTYVVATGLLSVYSMGIDTIFLSFLEDSERNDGSPEKPYYMSDSLKKIIHVSNKALEDNNKKKSGGKVAPSSAVQEY
ncbi:plasma-membrane choline transporter-domain-containing protein [Chytridium lagenaria]|nr:plasma-membrane choline transporter-domain-containing protein [Chytridium lagenaria]